MMRTAGEWLYLAGLVFAESLRIALRVGRLRSDSAWRGATRPARLPELLVLGTVLGGIWILPFVSIFTGAFESFDVDVPAWAVVVATAVFVASLALRWHAQRALGRQWSYTLETGVQHVLVTDGVYARSRHPIYASLILWALAQPLILQNAVAGAGGFVAVALIWLVRVPREEAMMVACFGDEYRAYAARTRRLWTTWR